MKILIALFATLALNLSPAFGAAECTIYERHKPEKEFALSNGDRVPLPTRSNDFDMQMIMGWLAPAAAQDALKGSGLYPVQIGGKAVGLMSAYNYKQSDVGPFAEFYFVIVATRDPEQSSYTSLLELLRSIRIGNIWASDRLAFYHVLAHSNRETTRLMSEEIWGIPSFAGQINVPREREAGFEVKVEGQSLVKLTVGKTLWMKNPLGASYEVMAAGADARGKLTLSPVQGCGPTVSAIFDSKKHLIETGKGSAVGELLQKLRFRPFRIEWGRKLQAVQFAPNP